MRAAMTSLAVATIGSVLLAGSWARAEDAAKVERGKEVYAEQKCKLCHSIGGEGNKKGSLDDVGSRLSAEEIGAWHRNPDEMAEKAGATRKPKMKTYGEDKLSEEDLDALVAYLLTLKG